MYPELFLDMARTLDTWDRARPKFWPASEAEVRALVQEEFVVGLSSAVKTAMATEDGTVALKPQARAGARPRKLRRNYESSGVAKKLPLR